MRKTVLRLCDRAQNCVLILGGGTVRKVCFFVQDRKKGVRPIFFVTGLSGLRADQKRMEQGGWFWVSGEPTGGYGTKSPRVWAQAYRRMVGSKWWGGCYRRKRPDDGAMGGDDCFRIDRGVTCR